MTKMFVMRIIIRYHTYDTLTYHTESVLCTVVREQSAVCMKSSEETSVDYILNEIWVFTFIFIL